MFLPSQRAPSRGRGGEWTRPLLPRVGGAPSAGPKPGRVASIRLPTGRFPRLPFGSAGPEVALRKRFAALRRRRFVRLLPMRGKGFLQPIFGEFFVHSFVHNAARLTRLLSPISAHGCPHTLCIDVHL